MCTFHIEYLFQLTLNLHIRAFSYSGRSSQSELKFKSSTFVFITKLKSWMIF